MGKHKRVIVIVDHIELFKEFVGIIQRLKNKVSFSFFCSPKNRNFKLKKFKTFEVKSLDVNQSRKWVIDNCDLVISLHSKQIFPSKLIAKKKCVNVHPGFLPYNRGWYPHIFSIINKKPTGATIHEMTNILDFGPIIDSQEIKIKPDDTSASLYKKIFKVEVKLIKKNIEKIIEGDYTTVMPNTKGNINYKKDYYKLLPIDRNKKIKAEKIINKIRALTHGECRGAYFIDKNKEKFEIKVSLRRVK
ncbi:MAG: dTDP-4-amino-4,6-dideoxyglucose formyltransferase [Candidatus Omnitrophica bacterium]|nr:dTDP-4-amino-4,6-dideoxyglucose formyltransferase [Candidatus Omnitrophota bacterium]MDD5429616.1 dTDP-4-amino-4,6-dideoxyglucose formyltransferase [Candidatus Omnitrophota bacterium]